MGWYRITAVLLCAILVAACVHRTSPVAQTVEPAPLAPSHADFVGMIAAEAASRPASPPPAPLATAIDDPHADVLAGETRILPPPDLWQRLRQDMHMELHLDQRRVQQEIKWLQRHPKYLQRLAPRLQRYLPYIAREVQLRNIPAEIALLPIVESALDVFAFSHGGAAGPWQFIRGTARQYGLDVNDWYDGRRDIIASTDAALNYLSDLEKRFDDWYLALAGYNAGQGNVSRALRKNPKAGFFDLSLPRETQAYVPRLLALAAVIKTPDRYSIKLPDLQPDLTFATANVHSQFQLSKLSEAIDLDMDAFYEWNPALSQWATPPEGPHRIILPISMDVDAAQLAIDAIPAKQRVDWSEITVRPGDTLSQIARRHGTDVASLQSANQLSNARIRAGHKLLIPKNAQALSQSPRHVRGTANYVVQSGDSMWSIARHHGVSLNKLMRQNHLGPKDTLDVGRKLQIPGAATTRKVVRKVHYKVRKGDSLARIAGKFNVSIKEIANWNNLDAKRYLQPGQGLLLYVNVVGG